MLLVVGTALWTASEVEWTEWRDVDWGDVPAYLAGIGFLIGGLGLTTWRRQLEGTYEFELARRTLMGVYKVRDALRSVRNPFMSMAEVGEHEEGGHGSPHLWQSLAYQRRWDRVLDADREFGVALLEVEVMWGDLLKADAGALRRHVVRLSGVIRQFLWTLQNPSDGTFDKPSFEILYGRFDSEDVYDVELDRLVAAVENKLRPKLQRRRALRGAT